MKPHKNQKIEEILASLDGVKRAPAPEFFYTRLIARMEKGQIGRENRPLILRPVFIMATLLLVLFMNALVVLNSRSSDTVELTEQDTEQSIAAEYNINSNLTYEINQ